MKDQPDLVIGGNLNSANGIISSDPDFSGSSLFLRSNNSLLLQLDHDNDNDGFLTVQNGAGNAVLSLGEQGNMVLAANSTLALPQLFLREAESGDYARFRLSNDSNNKFWDIAAGGNNNEELNFYRDSVGNVLQLHATGNPITTATGAYLSPGGMWTDNSSKTLKHLERAAIPNNVLSAINQLPIYYWRYKTEAQTLHIGPVAEDFHEIFGCGEGDQHLAPSDLASVALASVQALAKENRELKEKMHALTVRMNRLESNIKITNNN